MGLVEVSRHGDVALVTLNRAEVLNAQTPAMWAKLAEVGQNLDGACKAVVITGAGASFSAGLDKRMFTPEGIPGEPSLFTIAGLPDEEVLDAIATFQSAFTVWSDASFLSVAAVEGHAIGAGFQLALACDVVIAGANASFAMKEVTWGLVPDLAGTAPLVDRIGRARAIRACVTGASMTSNEPGLVDVVVSDGGALAAALAWCDQLPDAGLVAAHKRLLNGYGAEARRTQRAREAEAQLLRMRTLLRGA